MATGFILNQFFTTALNVGGGIDNSQTSGIIIQSVSGLDITKPGIALFSYSDPLSTSVAEWITYTSINGSNELQGVVRGAEGFSAKSHANQATVAFPLSESHVNNLTTALTIGGSYTNILTGFLDEDDMASNSAVKGATQQSIKAYVDAAAGGGALQDTDYSGTSATTSSTYANITGADASVTLTATSHILLIAVVQAYAPIGAISGSVDYTIRFHDGSTAIGQEIGNSAHPGNTRINLMMTHIVPSAAAGTYTYTIQHKSNNNTLSCTAEAINFVALAVPA